ncbi:MAG: exosortase K [Bacteroidota bacterium]
MKLTIHSVVQLILVIAVFCIAKLSWSDPSPDQVLFILEPTSWLVSLVFSSKAYFEPNIGFVHNKLDIVINGLCAGHNFLLITFLCSCFSIFQHVHKSSQRWFMLPLAALFSYLITPFMNLVRIVANMAYPKDLFNGLISDKVLHEMIGVVVYLISLIIIYQCVQKLLSKTTFTKVEENV